ncbi:MAG: 16S rRNA (guanine(966)-N(2))-methyltransferase RsmD [Chloroflexi bacterium]|jgi:16S rRNA (guanine966-N2)-methyltransferase|nr:16S rRNA (guanine(966)-N(2))-methyltransferase RsmD [Chloroflexota bacterium]
MRITGGIAKGQQLKVPKNDLVRPTTDRVREAIFSILASLTSHWSRGLDLFAGTGALGIEALSRDAEWVDFVDQQPKSCAIIKQNLYKVGFSQKAHVYCCSVAKALTFLDSKYDIVFMDPPYSDPSINHVAMQLANSKVIDDKSLIVISHASRFPLQQSYDGLSLIKEKRYGDTCISIYRKEVKH